MDLSETELAELEERLYSNIHHANADAVDVIASSNASTEGLRQSQIPSSSATSRPTRVVTDKSVINDARSTVSKMKRYWTTRQQSVKFSYPGISGNRPRSKSTDVRVSERGNEDAPGKRKTFTPYQSILGPQGEEISKDPDLGSVSEASNGTRSRKKKITQGVRKQVLNPSNIRNKKLEQLKKIKAKKFKAQKSRQKAFAGQQRLVATIELDSSSEEDGEYRSPDPIKQQVKEVEMGHQEIDDSDPDEVVLIPAAPPPLVCIESSDDDAAKDGFTHPKSRNKKNAKKVARCISPSNSSVMSDDFIGQNERARLNDSFIEGIANDEELECSHHRTLGSLLGNDRRDLTNISRETRAPSISSDGTVATSSDTTDPEKRNSLHKAATSKPTSQTRAVPISCSTPKQTLHVKKSSTNIKPQKQYEEDSIYAATSTKKGKTKEKRSNSVASDNSEGGNVSSHSKRSKSYHSDASSSKSSKKRHSKRRKHGSAQYSDEEFASMLTDIVQAVSENDEDGNSHEDQPAEPAKTTPAIIEQSQHSPIPTETTIEQPLDSSNDILEVKIQEPSTISLPQVESCAAPVCKSMVANESSDSVDVPLEPPAPPVINLLDDDTRDQANQGRESPMGMRQLDDDPEQCWNDEIKKFYHESWNCEDFNVSTVLFNMPRPSKFWPIINKDKFPDPPRKEITCNNCGERGHMRYKCRNPPKPRTCYMCGLIGHQEPRCPNTLCLKCGERTKNFLRGCQSCSREQNMVCHLCGVRGHGQRSCPDKWRRYHSTIEDNKPLTQSFVRNPNAKHCCICSRAGHQAHMCNAALKIFGQVVPTTEIKSYQPMYHLNERYRLPIQNNGPKYNLFSDMSDYRLNFDDSIAMNESSFYNRFMKSVGLFEKRKRRAEKLARKIKRAAKKRKQADKILSEESMPRTTIVYAEESQHEKPINPNPHETTNKTDKSPPSDRIKAPNEDSNYSFSEFYEDRIADQIISSTSLPDYIPLVSNESTSKAIPAVASANTEGQKTDAKIYLTKPHAKILLGPNGAAFLKDASDKYALKLSVSFQSVGNVLMANGLSKDQDNFHNELVKFLNDASHANEQLKQINNVPKVVEKTIRYITEHLQLLTRSYENVKNMFKRYQNFEQQGGNAKTCDKIRRTLNIILFGQFGMREGREHLNQLQVNLKALKNTKEFGVSLAFRDEINQHIRYIFTSYDHADYADIINEFEDLRKNQKLSKIKPEDLDLPPLLPVRNGELNDRDNVNASDESFNLSKDLSFEEGNSTFCFSDSFDDDLILNTSDQLIDPTSNRAGHNKQLGFDERNLSRPSPSESSFCLQAMPKFKYSSKHNKIDMLLNQCGQMAKMLNSQPVTAKFEKICSEVCEGHMSRATYRSLQGIYSTLRNKLQSRLQFGKRSTFN